jgi:hypothetical protein
MIERIIDYTKTERNNMYKIEILYFVGCPNFRKSCDIVCQVLEEQNIEFELNIKPIRTESENIYSTIFGSPTVLMDGIDVEECFKRGKGQPKHNHVKGLSCRLYDCEISKACPSEEMILCALHSNF